VDPWQEQTVPLAVCDGPFGVYVHGATDTSFRVNVNTWEGAAEALAEYTDRDTGDPTHKLLFRLSMATSLGGIADATPDEIELDAPCRQYIKTYDGLDPQTDHWGLVEWFAGYDLSYNEQWVPLPWHLYHAFTGNISETDLSDSHAATRYSGADYGHRDSLAVSNEVRCTCEGIDTRLLLDRLPDRVTQHGDLTMDASVASGSSIADWNTAFIQRYAYARWLYAPEMAMCSTAVTMGNWECFHPTWAFHTGAFQKQAFLAFLLAFPLGYYDGTDICPEPQLLGSIPWLRELTDVDLLDVAFDSWQRSLYCVPDGLDGDTAAGTGGSTAVLAMDAGHNLVVEDVCDVVQLSAGGPLVRTGMAVTDVTGDTATLTGGTGDDLTNVDGPYECRVHPTERPTRALMANGLQVVGSCEVSDAEGRKTLTVWANGDVYYEMPGGWIGYGPESWSHTTADAGQRWGALGTWLIDKLTASTAERKHVKMHRTVLVDGLYQTPGSNWKDQIPEALGVSIAASAVKTRFFAGHAHNAARSCVDGLWQIIVPSDCSPFKTPSGFGTPEIFGADIPQLWRAAIRGFALTDYTNLVEQVSFVQASVACSDYVPVWTSEPCAWGPSAYVADPDTNTVTVSLVPRRLIYACASSDFTAQGGLEGWVSNVEALIATSVAKDEFDTHLPGGFSGLIVELNDFSNATEMWLVAVPSLALTFELTSSAAMEDAGWSGRGEKTDIHVLPEM
jgi:hypothetical protein